MTDGVQLFRKQRPVPSPVCVCVYACQVRLNASPSKSFPVMLSNGNLAMPPTLARAGQRGGEDIDK